MTSRLATVALLALPRLLVAQNLADACRAMKHVEVGFWVEYQVVQQPGADPATIRQAIVGTESVDGAEFLVYESSMGAGREGHAVMQMLVAEYPFQPRDVRRMIMQFGSQPPTTVPPEMMAQMQSRMPESPAGEATARCTTGEVLGWERVETPAGTFSALHVRPQGEAVARPLDLWVSADIPFGIVKLELSGRESGAITLVGYGTDATPSIPTTR